MLWMLQGRTPLHYAAYMGRYSMVSELIQRCVSPRPRFTEPTFPLHFRSGALSDPPDSNGVTPVHVACDRGQADIAQLLCDCGADVNRRTGDGLCPLHLACRCMHHHPPPPLCSGCDFGLRNGNLDCTKVLIAHSCDIEARAAGSLTALHIAVQDNRCAPAAACAAAA